MINVVMTFVTCFSILLTAPAFARKSAASVKRTEIRVSSEDRMKLKDLTKSLLMVELTPIVNNQDEVLCLEISKINDRLVSDHLKAEVGDCLSEITAFKKSATGKVVSERVPILSPADAMMVYQKLAGATRVEVDLKRGKQIVPLAYVLN